MARGFGTVRLLRAALFVAALAGGATHSAGLSAPEQAALDRISADSLRGNLSFLASDELEGRLTPSRGLDVAAAFIAAQFRRAGLEPIGKEGSYFQTANLLRVTPDMEGFRLTLRDGKDELELRGGDVQVRSVAALDLSDAEVVTLPESGEAESPSIGGKVVAGGIRRYGSEEALARLQARKPALILLIGRRSYERPDRPWLEERDAANAPVIRVASEAAADAMGDKRELRASLHLAAPKTEAVMARNVGGILRGSDERLRDQYVLLTAHYDHLGMLPAGAPDRVFNGANDNGSGTVSVIEIAGALATLPVHPKRSILFLALYGEEEGLLGAFYYTRHPLEPLRDTVADINLEQLGRTDEQSGAQVGAFAFTGPSYSDLPAVAGHACFPARGEMYSAAKGHGAFQDGSRIHASGVRTKSEALLCCNGLGFMHRFAFAGELVDWMSGFWTVRSMGGCLDAMLLARGSADVWIEAQAKPWDLAPLKIIADEAGLVTFDFKGEDTIYGGNYVICVPALADEIKRFTARA